MVARHTLHVALTEPLVRHVRNQVAAGPFRTASEVLREALQLLVARDAERERTRSQVAGPAARHG